MQNLEIQNDILEYEDDIEEEQITPIWEDDAQEVPETLEQRRLTPKSWEGTPEGTPAILRAQQEDPLCKHIGKYLRGEPMEVICYGERMENKNSRSGKILPPG